MPGTQMSMFDIGFASNVVTKDKILDKKELILDINKPAMAKDILIENSTPKVDKVKKPLELTAEQQNFINQNKIMENENLSRVILYADGSLGVELNRMNNFETLYINTNGEKEFTLSKKSPVLPNDKISYYKTDFDINTIQQQKLQEVKEQYKNKIKRIIHRHGDENILIEVEGKLFDIIPKGWVLEFTETTHIDCKQDEILENFKEDKKDAGQLVQPGDLVQARIGKSLVEGTITHTYGLGNAILNIDFEKNGKMFATAIPRAHVKEIMGKAKCVFWQYTEDSIVYFCPKCKKILNSHEPRCSCGQEINWSTKAMCEDKIKTS